MTKTEAVARAICRACGHDPDTVMAINLGVGDGTAPLHELAVPLWRNFRAPADAAVKALHVPTRAMLDAADELIWMYDRENEPPDETVRKIWQAMICTALTERQEDTND